jgi:hypothetical protein
MSLNEKKKLENLVRDCESELLNHTLQNEVVSPAIKNIKSILDECLSILQKDWEQTPKTRVVRFPRKSGAERENLLFFAYCISKWNHQFFNKVKGRIFNQTQVIEYLADKLGTNANSLRNYRDLFDSHVEQQNSDRRGWLKPLNDEFKDVIQKYDSKSEDELVEIAKEILQSL